ncbi:MAG: alpha/beta hydrolase [Bacteroidales bacterium]|nr:alpha/beta hydrolase [Bacteroidales bacterium]
MDYNIKLKNGQVLRGLINSPGEKMYAIIIFVHDLGEHIQRYKTWADLLNRDGIGFTGMDLPGHGRSDGKRGHIQSYSLTDEMIDILHEHVRNTFPGIPVFYYGHSLGGTIVLDYLLRKKPEIKGAIVTSPWLKLSFEPDKFKIALASVMRFILPGLIQPSGLVADHLSHDKEVVDNYIADPLVHDKISVSLFHSTVSAARNSLAHASELEVPLLLMHGSDDMICSPGGSREFAAAAAKAELKIWEGGYHELHDESFKTEVFSFLVNWMNRIPG